MSICRVFGPMFVIPEIIIFVHGRSRMKTAQVSVWQIRDGLPGIRMVAFWSKNCGRKADFL